MGNTVITTFENLPAQVNLLQQEVINLKNIIISFENRLFSIPVPSVYMNIDEVAQLTFKSVNTIYSLTSKSKIPHYKNGNKLYFKRNEIQDWISTGRVKTVQNIDDEVDNFTSNKRN